MHIDLSRAEIEVALQTIELALTSYRTPGDKRARPPAIPGSPPTASTGLDHATLSALRQKLTDVCAIAQNVDDLDLDFILEPADA